MVLSIIFCLFTICRSPLVRHLFLSFVHFKILCFLSADFTISLKIFGKIVISNIYFASISPRTTCGKIYPFPLDCPHTFVGISWLHLCGSVYGLSICFNWSLSILLPWFLLPYSFTGICRLLYGAQNMWLAFWINILTYKRTNSPVHQHILKICTLKAVWFCPASLTIVSMLKVRENAGWEMFSFNASVKYEGRFYSCSLIQDPFHR